MAFRDDREAMLARSEALERDLARTKQELARSQADGAAIRDKLDDAEKRARSAERKIAITSFLSSPRFRQLLVIGLVAIGGGLGFVLSLGRDGSAVERHDRGAASRPGAEPTALESPPVPRIPLPETSAAKLDPEVVYAIPFTAADAQLGADQARVVIIEAFSAACPHCRDARSITDDLLRDYPDDLKVVYKHFIVNEGGTAPGLALCAANRQQRFVAMLDLVWGEGNRDLGAARMTAFAERIGLDMTRYHDDFANACREIIDRDQRLLAGFRTRAVPTFYVNGRGQSGANPAALRELVAGELSVARERIAAGTPLVSYYTEWVVMRGDKNP